jgi:hypothetical protein
VAVFLDFVNKDLKRDYGMNPDRTSKFTWISISLLSVTVVLGTSTLAHHNESVKYNTSTTDSVVGVVTRIEWRNPHVYLYLSVESSNSQSTIWEIEGPPPAALRRAGWSREDLEIGDRISIDGHPSRDSSSTEFLMNSLTTAENTTIGMDIGLASVPEADDSITDRATNLEGIWGTVFDLETILVLVEASKLALTERGRLAVESYNEPTDNPALNCIRETAPKAMLYPDIKSIEISDSIVTIRSGSEALVRTVYIDRNSHDGSIPASNGHSIGRWEGEKLVIDTANFSPHRQGNATGLPSGPQKHLIEELELIQDGARVRYYYELRDPEYFEGTVSDQIEFAYRPDLDYVELPCDVENARRYAQ